MSPGSIAWLAGYVNEPVVQDAILTHIRTLEFPFLLREVVEATGFPRHTVNKVLTRLVKKGILARHQIPMSSTTCIGGSRPTYLYRLTDAE